MYIPRYLRVKRARSAIDVTRYHSSTRACLIASFYPERSSGNMDTTSPWPRRGQDSRSASNRGRELSRAGSLIKEDGERRGIIVMPSYPRSISPSGVRATTFFALSLSARRAQATYHPGRPAFPSTLLPLPGVAALSSFHLSDALYDHQRRGSFADLRLSKL